MRWGEIGERDKGSCCGISSYKNTSTSGFRDVVAGSCLFASWWFGFGLFLTLNLDMEQVPPPHSRIGLERDRCESKLRERGEGEPCRLLSSI